MITCIDVHCGLQRAESRLKTTQEVRDCEWLNLQQMLQMATLFNKDRHMAVEEIEVVAREAGIEDLLAVFT